VRRLRLESGGHGVTEIGGGPAAGALAAQVGGYPGVRQAYATLRGSPASPRLDLRVSLTDDASVAAVLVLLREEAVRDLRAALGVERLPALVRIGVGRVEDGREVR
jgi:hypothetical protein